MKRAVLVVIIVVGSVAVWRLGSRLSADAVGLAVGGLLGTVRCGQHGGQLFARDNAAQAVAAQQQLPFRGQLKRKGIGRQRALLAQRLEQDVALLVGAGVLGRQLTGVLEAADERVVFRQQAQLAAGV